jgi:predicted RND superfamily exporter protein
VVRLAAILTALARGSARRPLAVLAGALVLAAVGAGFALRLRPTAATDTLVNRSSASFRATERYHQRFGDDPVIVLVRGPLRDLVLTDDLERMLGLEGCLSGNLPRGVVPRGGPAGPCAQIARERATQFVLGPGTFINESANELTDQFTAQQQAQAQRQRQAADAAYRVALARGATKAQARKYASQAAQLVQAEFLRTLISVATQYGLTRPPSINDPDFVSTLVFDSTKPLGTPKTRFSALFPSPGAAIVQVRLHPGLSDAKRKHAITLIRQAVAMPDWQPKHGGSYLVTGMPVIVSDLTGSITSSLIILLIAALAVMAATLALVFRGRPRLLPLGIALAAAALTFGALAVSGASLTMASIGVLPVLIGLAVDYAIQFQSRYEEARAHAPPAQAVERAAALGAPTIAAAGAATAGGFLVLALPVIGSPVPMVRDFGLLLVIGVVAAFICALSAGSAALVLAGRDPRGAVRRPLRMARALAARAERALGPSLRGAWEIVTTNRLLRAVRARALAGAQGAFALALARPTRVLGIACALALVGWGLDTQTRVESDIQKLVPQNLGALRNLDVLQRATHVGGEIDVMVSADDLAQTSIVSWMTDYQHRVQTRFGYSAARGCGQAQLCPAFSLPDLFQTQGAVPTQSDIRALLAAVPPYFSQGVITADHRTATMAFGIRLMPLAEQKRVIDVMRRELRPPPGVHAELVGLPVLAADAHAQVALAAPRHAARRAARGRAGAARRAAPGTPRARAAGPDRARDGLVGARAVRDPRAFEPDVGHARRAGDRDLDRVQRAARRALPPGTRGGPRASRRARADLRLDRGGGARLRRDGDRRLRRARALRHPAAAQLRLRHAR